MISGKPVKSSIARTCSPASVSSWAVPPVETISMPSSARPRAKSTIPRLSDTERSALRTRTSWGCVVSAGPAMGPSIVKAAAGKTRHMTEHGPNPGDQIERSADQLEEDLDRLEGRLDAKGRLQERQEGAQGAPGGRSGRRRGGGSRRRLGGRGAQPPARRRP